MRLPIPPSTTSAEVAYMLLVRLRAGRRVSLRWPEVRLLAREMGVPFSPLEAAIDELVWSGRVVPDPKWDHLTLPDGGR